MRYASLNIEPKASSSTIMVQENLGVRNGYDYLNPRASGCFFDVLVTGLIDLGIQHAAKKKEKKKPELYSMKAE